MECRESRALCDIEPGLGSALFSFLFFLASFFPSLESQRETVEDLQLISTSTWMLFANAIRYAHLTRAPGTGVS